MNYSSTLPSPRPLPIGSISTPSPPHQRGKWVIVENWQGYAYNQNAQSFLLSFPLVKC